MKVAWESVELKVMVPDGLKPVTVAVQVDVPPIVTAIHETIVVVSALLTVRANALLVLAALLVSPLYVAVM